jgi:DNA-binding transcriptional ArsR family regulator
MKTPSHDDETRCATYLKALGDPLRLQIMRALQTGRFSVSDLSILLEQEIGTVSHHLRVLFHAGLVTTEREGKFIYYSWSEMVRSGRAKKVSGSLDFGCCKLDIGPMGKP